MLYTSVNKKNISLEHMKTELEIKVTTSARDDPKKGEVTMYTYAYVTSSHKLQVIVSNEMSNNESSFILSLPYTLPVCHCP